MRVLHLTWEYPPLVYGGIARHVHELASAQAAAGDDVTVITQAHPEAPADAVVDGVRVIRVAHDPPHLPFGEQTLLAWVLALNSSLSRALVKATTGPGPDVVHAHDWVVAHSLAMARGGLDLPTVATFHATEAGRHQGWVPTDLAHHIGGVERWLADLADAVITCSRHMRWEVGTLFGDPDRVTVIPNGIDPAPWQASGADTRSGSADPLIVFAGRLEWEKGIFDLLDAVADVLRQRPQARLFIAGSGGQEQQVMARIGEHPLRGRVEMAGRLDRTALGAAFRRASLVVVPSRYEPFGLVALEAAAAGAPLLVTDTGGLADIGDGGSFAALVAPGDPAALSAAIAECLTDEASATRRSRALRDRLATDYDWPTIAGQTAGVYANAVDASHHRREEPPDVIVASALDPFGPYTAAARPQGNVLYPAPSPGGSDA